MCLVRYLRIEQQDIATFRVYLQHCDPTTIAMRLALQQRPYLCSTPTPAADAEDECKKANDGVESPFCRDDEGWNVFCQATPSAKRRRTETQTPARGRRCETHSDADIP
eukprot:Selendium_serpulae@DN6662_c0_g1_i1.p3